MSNMSQKDEDERASEAPSFTILLANEAVQDSDLTPGDELEVFESDHDQGADTEDDMEIEPHAEDEDEERSSETADEYQESNKENEEEEEEEEEQIATPDEADLRASSSHYELRKSSKRLSSARNPKYDQKYHPMDVHTRPMFAARRLGVPAYVLAVSTPQRMRAPSKAGCPSSSSFAERERDPKAQRSSSRAAAKQFHNYNTKRHPQDHGIPGFQHLAPRVDLARPTGSTPTRARRRKRATLPNSEPDEVEESIEEQPFRPRKKLRQLDDNRPPKTKTQKKRSKKKIAISSDADDIADQALLMIGVDPTQLAPTQTRAKPRRLESPVEVNYLVEDARSQVTSGHRPKGKHRGSSQSRAIPISSDDPSSDATTSSPDLDIDDVGQTEQELQGRHTHDARTANDMDNTEVGDTSATSSRTLGHEPESRISEPEHEPPSEFDEEFAITDQPWRSLSNANEYELLLVEAEATDEARGQHNSLSQPSPSPRSEPPSDDVPPSSAVDATVYSFEDDDDGDHYVDLADLPINQPKAIDIYLSELSGAHSDTYMPLSFSAINKRREDQDEVGPQELREQMM